jgi:hypothetical protein
LLKEDVMHSAVLWKRATVAVLLSWTSASCANAHAQPTATYWHESFRGDQVDDINRAWTAIRAEFRLDANLRDCLIGYARGPNGVATVHFAINPRVVETTTGRRLGPVLYFIANVDAERVHVFQEGEGEVVIPQ